ncbi:hypothetical protein NE634_18725, partial [Lacrimispora saccharolytica]|nr:hypothetical protein [Lacrimispora saccharolytica]
WNCSTVIGLLRQYLLGVFIPVCHIDIFGSLFDATQTMVVNLEDGTSQVQVVSWYDNENSYVSQLVRTIKYFSELA